MSFDILEKVKVGVTLLLEPQLSSLAEVHQGAAGNAKQFAGLPAGKPGDGLRGVIDHKLAAVFLPLVGRNSDVLRHRRHC